MNINYRKMGLNDIDTAIKFRIVFLKEIQNEISEVDESELKIELNKYFTSSIKDESYISYFAEIGGKTVGTSGMVVQTIPGHFKFKSGRLGYILNMYTLPEYRGLGICNTLLNCLIKEAKEINLGKVYLHATDDGINIYKNSGFIKPNWPVLEKNLIDV